MIRAFENELEEIERGLQGSFPAATGAWNEIPAAPAEGYRELRSDYAKSGGVPDGQVVIITGDYGAKMFAAILPRRRCGCRW